MCGFGAVHYYKVNEGGFEETQNVDVEYIITLMTSCLFYTAYGDTVAMNYMSIYSAYMMTVADQGKYSRLLQLIILLKAGTFISVLNCQINVYCVCGGSGVCHVVMEYVCCI